MLILYFGFFIIALLYASIGFGGGSSYIALLSIGQVDYEMIPVLGLICNLTVTAQGTFQYILHRRIRWGLAFPFILMSIPFSFMGGAIRINEIWFLSILATVLTVSSLLMLIPHRTKEKPELKISHKKRWGGSLLMGGGIGLVSGVAGIGGGIFLSPLLNLLAWAKAKEIASLATVFIFTNSLFGLAGQLSKHTIPLDSITPYLFFPLVVLIGGVIGSRLNIKRLSNLLIYRLTGALVLLVSVRLWVEIFINHSSS